VTSAPDLFNKLIAHLARPFMRLSLNYTGSIRFVNLTGRPCGRRPDICSAIVPCC
jgi:hypothetical protein